MAEEKTKKLTYMTALRNKTVARTFLQSFKRTLTVSVTKIVEIQKICYHENVTSHFSSLYASYTSPIMHLICPHPPPLNFA